MSHQSNLIADDIHQYLKQHEEKDLLRFITCGSVDDGKSTLIGRLLHDTKMIYEDQLAAISKDSKAHGTTGEQVDLALLVDGLQSEREQGITIDVAYRYFSTEKRKFIIADTPGHEQYTRNMATGASTASLAILLIDARYGVQTQTRRHSFICSLLGIKHFVIAINKMDLVDYSQERFLEISNEYKEFAENLDVPDIQFIPISALKGVNVAGPAQETSWYKGSYLLDILENVSIDSDENEETLRFPVQYVNRPNLDFRGFCGTLASGVLKKGQSIKALPSQKTSTVKSIVTYSGEIEAAFPGDAITLTIADEIDISRGDMIVSNEETIKPVNNISADVVWMHENELQIGKNYYIKIGASEVTGMVTEIKYQVDVNTLEKSNTSNLPLNCIGRCLIELTEPVIVDPYLTSKHTGNLIFIDRLTNVTVGAGMVEKAIESEIAHADGVEIKPSVIWLTGLSGAGKSTTANTLFTRLKSMGIQACILDGDNIRQGLCSDLSYSEADRKENIRRVGEVSRLITDAGLVAIVAMISPYRQDREAARKMMKNQNFYEVYLNTPLDICEKRDPKGLYTKARRGEISNFTGVSSPYESPEKCELVIDTTNNSVEENVNQILDMIGKE